MATYQTANVYLQSQAIAGRRWFEYSDTGPVADVVASGFFTDGYNRGMRTGDLLRYYDTSRTIWYALRVSAATDTGATQVTADGQVILADTS